MTTLPLLARALGGAASACPFCFSRGLENTAFGKALPYGIFGLIVTTLSILTTLAVTVVRMEQRKAAADAAQERGRGS